jgi:hypothetical protein
LLYICRYITNSKIPLQSKAFCSQAFWIRDTPYAIPVIVSMHWTVALLSKLSKDLLYMAACLIFMVNVKGRFAIISFWKTRKLKLENFDKFCRVTWLGSGYAGTWTMVLWITILLALTPMDS